jgi:hypothetical protein
MYTHQLSSVIRVSHTADFSDIVIVPPRHLFWQNNGHFSMVTVRSRAEGSLVRETWRMEMEVDSISYPQTPESCKFCICFDKVQLMEKLRPSPTDGFSVVYLQAGDCHMHLGAQCPVINELRFDLSAFTSHLLCRLYGRLIQTELIVRPRSDICNRLGRPTRCEYLKMLRGMLGAWGGGGGIRAFRCIMLR